MFLQQKYMSAMFYGCSSLSDISPLRDWDVTNVSSTQKMFEGCVELEDLSPIFEWILIADEDEMFSKTKAETNGSESYPHWYTGSPYYDDWMNGHYLTTV